MSFVSNCLTVHTDGVSFVQLFRRIIIVIIVILIIIIIVIIIIVVGFVNGGCRAGFFLYLTSTFSFKLNAKIIKKKIKNKSLYLEFLPVSMRYHLLSSSTMTK